MGSEGPLLVWRGDVTLHKEQTIVGQHGRDHTSNFTQVWAAMRRKTLLLLWWIDGGRMVVERSTPAPQGCIGRQWLRAYECVRIQLSNPFYDCHGPPFIS